MASNSTGYGPRHRAYFDGDETKYELWETKFLAFMRLQKLYKIFIPDGESEPTDFNEKNKDAFAELVQCLDDRSLSLIIREANEDGRKALKVLRSHYLGTGKPRILTLYSELTSLKKGINENVTDYVIRAETGASSLKNAGETISDSLLITMVLKGLPSEYNTFAAIVTHGDEEMTFSKFKVALKSHEETLKTQDSHQDSDSVMNMKHSGAIICYSCNRPGHKSPNCPNKKQQQTQPNAAEKWCSHCKTKTHFTKFCRKLKHSAKSAMDDHNNSSDTSSSHTFAFKVNVNMSSSKDVVFANSLLVDCGATAHMINDKSKFIEFDENFNASEHFIELADGTRTSGIVTGKGVALYKVHDENGTEREITLNNALYVPSFKQNIFSVHAATQRGAFVNFEHESACLQSPDGTKFPIAVCGKLYYLNSISTNTGDRTAEEWHKVLGHCNYGSLFKLQNVVNGMKITDKCTPECEICIQGKMSQHFSRKADVKADKPLKLVHSDLAGPITPTAREGFEYSMVFVDDYTGTIFVYFLKKKSDALQATKRFLADCAPYGTVKCIRSDNGGEYISHEYKQLLIDNKIKHEMCAPYSPHQNGTAERSWRSLFDMARCLMLESKLPKSLWTYAVKMSAYIRNRCYNPRLDKTPVECLTGKKPNLSKLEMFGSKCYAYDQNVKSKLDSRCTESYFVGYDGPAYLVYYPSNRSIKKVRCVKFMRTSETDVDYDIVYTKEPEVGTTVDPKHENVTKNVNENADVSEVRRSERQRQRPAHLNDYVTEYVPNEKLDTNAYVSDVYVHYCYKTIPKTYEEAIVCEDNEKWQAAMHEEYEALNENDTFNVTELPIGKTVIDGRWVYALKQDPDGNEKFKARYVAKGYSQVEGVNYNETFSPTARMSSIRMLAQLAVHENFSVHQMDVKTAFLNAPIDTEIYVKQPKGFVQGNENQVLKLNKSLYGLKQSGRNWNTTLHNFLIGEGFVQSLADYCVYVKHDGNVITVLIIWVDDIIIACNSDSALSDIKNALKRKYKMKDLGVISYFLGIEFKCSENVIEMSQEKYIDKILSRFGMSDCKPKAIPCELGVSNATVDDRDFEDVSLYREVIGSLIYLMTTTRPDLCYVVGMLSQHLAKPKVAHYAIAKQTLRYLKGTKSKTLKFVKTETLDIVGYSDSDWANDKTDRRSVSGMVFSLGETFISWRSKKQPIVALSTCEAEYIALSFSIQEAKFLQQLLADITCCEPKPVQISVDNQSAIALSKNPVNHQRSKHIDVKFHYIRQEISNGNVIVEYIPTEFNKADAFTKPLSASRLKMLLN